MAKICVHNLRLKAIVGTNDFERQSKQDLIFNITIHYDAFQAAMKDDLKEAVDYDAVIKKIVRMVETSHFFLLEKLSHETLKVIMRQSLVSEAIVRIDKIKAIEFCDSISVELQQSRGLEFR